MGGRSLIRHSALAGCVLLAVSLVGAGPAAAGGPTEPDDLAVSALQGALRTTDSQALDSRVRQARQTTAERAAHAPDTQASASVVFDRGLSAAEVDTLAGSQRLELIGAEVKAPVAASGQVYTLWLNDFTRTDGTVRERLDRATGKARLHYFQQAKAVPGEEQALTGLAGGDWRFYRIEVSATNARLDGLTRTKSVLAVLPDPDDRKVTALREAQASRKALPAAPVRLVSGDPAKAATGRGAPVITNSGQNCRWQKSTEVLACQPAPARRVTGDPAVDAALPAAEGAAVAGTSKPARTTAPRSRLLDDSAAWTACNSAASGEICPNDHTYRPHLDTGGYQDFAVAVSNYAPYSIFYECYAVWVDNPYEGDGQTGHWETRCYAYVVSSRPFTYGAAAWISRWGTRMTNLAAINRDVYISTLAFKGGDTQVLQPCVVQQFGPTASCSGLLPDSVWVPNPGMEDEVLIDNPACSPPIGGRRGTTADWDYGCFYPTLAASDLPSAFLDTTFEDKATPYDLAIGSANPKGIVEGRTYSNYAEFASYNNNDMIGRHAFHSVAADARVNNSLACSVGGGTDAFCFFPVDSSRVSEVATFIPG